MVLFLLQNNKPWTSGMRGACWLRTTSLFVTGTPVPPNKSPRRGQIGTPPKWSARWRPASRPLFAKHSVWRHAVW